MKMQFLSFIGRMDRNEKDIWFQTENNYCLSRFVDRFRAIDPSPARSLPPSMIGINISGSPK